MTRRHHPTAALAELESATPRSPDPSARSGSSRRAACGSGSPTATSRAVAAARYRPASMAPTGSGPQGRRADRHPTAQHRRAARYTEWIANDRQLHRTVAEMRALAEKAREIILAAEQASGSAP